MDDKKIIKELNNYYKIFSSMFPNLDPQIRSIYVDLWEIYNDLIFEKKDYNNVLTLLKKIKKYSKANNVEKLLSSLTELEIKLEHSQNHLKEARGSIRTIVNKICKTLPDDND